MKLVFVHGWSVTSTETYGELPEVLKREAPQELNIEIENIYLGEYISFHDEVTLEDIARAFERARKEKFGDEKFVCITHSTGGPVVRLWIDLFFVNSLEASPISHLIMLAPANHGSSLAILGKGKLSRIKAWVQGMEPGDGVLQWLQLGSNEQWQLNLSWLNYEFNENTFFPFVLSGEKIDNHFYDFLNSYLVEKGSDGVVRLTGANLNYQTIKLIQDCSATEMDAIVDGTSIKAFPLLLDEHIKNSKECAFEVIQNASHAGDTYGIMASVKKKRKVKPVVSSILEALHVNTTQEYISITSSMREKTKIAQVKKHKYIMFVFHIKDNYGNNIHDYDMLMLAGNTYEPGKLPKGFFVDKQKNNVSGNLVYYLDYEKIKDIKDSKFGIRIIARPDEGFTHYVAGEFRSDSLNLENLFKGNQTVMVDIILERRIAENTFVLDTFEDAKSDFKKRKPSKEKL